MSKKSESSKRAQRQQQESAALNHIYTSFLVGLAAECYLFLVYRCFIAGSVGSMLVWAQWVLPILMWVGLAATIGGAALAVWKKADKKLCRIGVIAAAAGAFFVVTSIVMLKFFDAGVITMCAAVPVVTILALIYFLYQRDCFLNTVVLSGTLFTLWVCSRGLDGAWKIAIIAGVAIVAAALIAMCIVAAKVQKNGGKLGKLQIFSQECDYRMIYVIAALAILTMAAAVLFPSVIYYLIWGAVIVLFGELAYYTVKMM